MKEHPHANHLEHVAAFRPNSDFEREALANGAAAIRALAALRPHWPSTVSGDQIAVLVVPYAAMMEARRVLGDYDLGPWDRTEAQQALDDAREARIDELTKAERREKYELRR